MSRVAAEEDVQAVAESTNPLNAEQATLVALDFLKRLGVRKGLKPKKVSLEGQSYLVELEMKNKEASIQIDSTTKEIKEYSIENKAEEASRFVSLSPKTLVLIFGMAIVLALLFDFLGVPSLLKGFF